MNQLLTVFDWTAYLTGLLGAPLGWIEYFYPNMADKIENKIDRGQTNIEKWGDKFTRHHLFEVLLTVTILLFFFLIYIPISHYSDYTPAIILPTYAWVLIVLLYLPVIIGIGSYFLAWMIEICNNATDGHALGTIGLGLIVIGVICDSADKILSLF